MGHRRSTFAAHAHFERVHRVHVRAAMNRSLAALAVLALAACGPDFRGERGLGFDSSLAHQYVPWTPAQPIARGTPVTFNFRPEPCLISCPPTLFYTARVAGAALRELDGGIDSVTALAEATGTSTVIFTQLDGGPGDRFTVRVTEAAAVSLTDPLAFNQHVYPQFIGFDGGTWPDVGTSLVMGPGGDIYLEVLVHDGAGAAMGYAASELGTSISGGGGWAAKTAGRQIDLHSPGAGAATFDVTWGDAGVARTFAVRVAGPEEATLEGLLVQVVSSQGFVLKADVRTLDGGPFLEPELVWEPDPGFLEVDTLRLAGLRPRRDVKVYDFYAPDAGPHDAAVSVRLGNATARVVVHPFVELTEPPSDDPVPEPQRGCGCSTSGPALLLAIAALVMRRMRRR